MSDPHNRPDRRKSPRVYVNLPASVKVISSPMTGAFSIRDAAIRDLSVEGVGLYLTVETLAMREEFAKMIVRRRACIVICQFPGCERTSELCGDIAWVEPRVTSKGAEFRFGVCLDTSIPGKLADLQAYLKTLEARSTAKATKTSHR